MRSLPNIREWKIKRTCVRTYACTLIYTSNNEHTITANKLSLFNNYYVAAYEITQRYLMNFDLYRAN